MTIKLKLTEGRISIIDDADFDLSLFKWSSQDGYAIRHIGGRKNPGKQWLHRVILERVLGRPLRKGERADHIDRNPGNNSRDNIRLANHFQNMHNYSKPKSNTSGYKGVSFHKATKKWAAQFIFENKHIWLGVYKNKIDAARAYDKKAIEMYGEFANPNFKNRK